MKIDVSDVEQGVRHLGKLAASKIEQLKANMTRPLLRSYGMNFLLGLSHPPKDYDAGKLPFPIHLQPEEHSRRAQLPGREKLEMAAQRLARFLFVGVTNRFNESVCLWAFTYGRPHLDFMDFSRHDLTEATAHHDRAFEGVLDPDVESMCVVWRGEV